MKRLRLQVLKQGIALLTFGLLMSFSALAQLPTAQQVASQMKVGWNLGNTLECTGGETAWGNPVTSQTLINAVKAAGFNTVRIPCAWDSHTSSGVIDATWIARVKAVVDYCTNNNMYVILNIHWDGGWLEKNVTTSAQTAVNAKQKSYWTQIANYFKSYNEHLLFASANEPDVSDATGMSVLLSYHQTFIDAVRATGGNNSSRTLIIQGPGTDIVKTNNLMNTMPTDQIASRLMVEVHYYSPYQFCLMTADASWGNMFYYWGNGNHSTTDTAHNPTWGEESDLDTYFGQMKSKFVDKGYPVIIGEFAAIKRTNLTGSALALHQASREYYNKYVVSSAVGKGIIPVYWDNGASDMGIFNRSTGAITDQGVVNAIMAGAGISTTQYITLKNRATGLLIDGMGLTANGSNCSQYSSSGNYNQQWILETVGSYVKLKNRSTGLYLDGMGRTTNGSVAGQYSGGSSNNQQWAKETVGSYVKFKNRGTGLYLDGMGKTANASDLGQWASSSSNNQQWSITTTKAALLKVDKSVSDCTAEVYPNPVTDNMVTITGLQGQSQITLVDVNGKVVQESNVVLNESYTYSLKVSPGLYVMHITNGGSNIYKKLLVR